MHFTLIPAAPDWWVTHWYLGILIGVALLGVMIAGIWGGMQAGEMTGNVLGGLFVLMAFFAGVAIEQTAIQELPRPTGVLHVAASTMTHTVAQRVERTRTALGFPIAVDPAPPAISSARLTQTLTSTPTARWHGWTLLSAVWVPTAWSLRHTALAPSAIRAHLKTTYAAQIDRAGNLLLQTVRDHAALYHAKSLAVSATALQPIAAQGLQNLAPQVPAVCSVHSTCRRLVLLWVR
jgi:hypothetical protein